MQENQKQKKEIKEYPIGMRLMFSDFVLSISKAKKIAFTAMAMALAITVNALLEIPIGGTQFSLTIFVSVLIGIMFGALPGFTACFFGDLIGFLLHPKGEYSPVIGVATGLMAVIAAWSLLLVHFRFKGSWAVKLTFICVGVFFVCTAGLNTLYLNAVWYPNLTFFECLFTRLIVEGQIWNSLVNYALLFILLPILAKIKPLKIKIA